MKKTRLLIILASVMAIFCLCLTACPTDDPSEYTVKFNLSGGHAQTGKANDFADQVVAPDGTATQPESDPERDGYTFEGWLDGNGLAFDFENTKITSDITLKPDWQVITYTLTFKWGNDVLTDTGNVATYNVETATFNLVALTDDDFDGWYTNADLTGDPVTSIAKGSIGDKVFYAKFNITYYTLTFDLDGGHAQTGHENDFIVKSIAEGTNAAAPLSFPEKDGYTFDGWLKNDTEFTFPVTMTENITVTANWIVIPYTISYKYQDNTDVATEDLNGNVTTYDIETQTITLVALENSRFEGWFSDIECTNAVTEIPLGSFGNKTFYAKLGIVQYMVTIDLDGGSALPGEESYLESGLVAEDTNLTIFVTPVKWGYTFSGWLKDDVAASLPITITEATTIKANWIADVYTITYYGETDSIITPSSSHPQSFTVETGFPIAIPTWTAERFEGWCDNIERTGDFLTAITFASGDELHNISLYAKMTPKVYTLTDFVATWTSLDSNYKLTVASSGTRRLTFFGSSNRADGTFAVVNNELVFTVSSITGYPPCYSGDVFTFTLLGDILTCKSVVSTNLESQDIVGAKFTKPFKISAAGKAFEGAYSNGSGSNKITIYITIYNDGGEDYFMVEIAGPSGAWTDYRLEKTDVDASGKLIFEITSGTVIYELIDGKLHVTGGVHNGMQFTRDY